MLLQWVAKNIRPHLLQCVAKDIRLCLLQRVAKGHKAMYASMSY